jgi:hypothetical protein
MTGNLTGSVAFGDLTLEGPTLWDAPQFVGRLIEQGEVVSILNVARIANEVILSWPANETGFVVETARSLPSTTWTPVEDETTTENGQRILRLQINASERFFRLRRP